jgi:hypothetical protein
MLPTAPISGTYPSFIRSASAPPILRSTGPSPVPTSDELTRRAVDSPRGTFAKTSSHRSIVSAREVCVLAPHGRGMTRIRVTPGHLKQSTDQVYKNLPLDHSQPGLLTHLVDELSPEDRHGKPAAKGLTVAYMTLCSELSPGLTARPVFEAAVLATWNGGFQFCYDRPLLHANGCVAGSEIEGGAKIVSMLIDCGFARQNDPSFSVIDIGTGSGVVPHLLSLAGVQNVKAIEPYSFEVARSNFKNTERLTAKQFTEDYPGETFSLVLHSNFGPFLCADNPDPLRNVAAARDMTYRMAKLTARGGLGLAGINGIDWAYASPGSPEYLHPDMATQYAKVEFASARRLGREFSVAGQMGYYIGSKPTPRLHNSGP